MNVCDCPSTDMQENINAIRPTHTIDGKADDRRLLSEAEEDKRVHELYQTDDPEDLCRISPRSRTCPQVKHEHFQVPSSLPKTLSFSS